jgi:hypothetical protein
VACLLGMHIVFKALYSPNFSTVHVLRSSPGVEYWLLHTHTKPSLQTFAISELIQDKVTLTFFILASVLVYIIVGMLDLLSMNLQKCMHEIIL